MITTLVNHTNRLPLGILNIHTANGIIQHRKLR